MTHAARSGPRGHRHARDAARGASASASTPEFIRDEVARGRLVIPANVRHLAGSGGDAPPRRRRRARDRAGRRRPSRRAADGAPTGSTRPSRSAGARSTIPTRCAASARPKRLDPTGIGRMITTKINANIGASPVSSGTDEEVEKLALGAALRRRHGDGPLDRRRPRRLPPGDHRPRDHPDRHRADLLHDHRPAHRGPHLRRDPEGDRAPGAAGRRLLHDPRRRAARAPAAGRARA